MADACCPASCGELLQGWILGSEKLVSCPIDWFSHVSVNEGKRHQLERPRMRRMLNAVLAHFKVPANLSNALRIDFYSTIPIGKGLASSTADIAATALATARFLEKTLDNATLARLCVAIEPTDSTIFETLTLFDHKKAQTQFACHWSPAIDILLLESQDILLTEEYHRVNRDKQLLSKAEILGQAWQTFMEACQQQDAAKLGEAATLSAIASQSILPKPGFNQLLDIVEKSSIYGLNVAHSGSVIGLLYDNNKTDSDDLYNLLIQHNLTQYYPIQHKVKMIAGGVR